MLEEALVDLFELHRDELVALDTVDGISFDIIPSAYQTYAAISFRQQSDYLSMDPYNEDRALMYSPGDWEYYSLLEYRTCRSEKFREAAKYIFRIFEEIYEEVGEYDGIQQDINHLLYSSIAEGAMQRSVAAKLQECGVDAPIIEYRFQYGFDYMVMDVDSPTLFNYCDLVVADRMTKMADKKLIDTAFYKMDIKSSPEKELKEIEAVFDAFLIKHDFKLKSSGIQEIVYENEYSKLLFDFDNYGTRWGYMAPPAILYINTATGKRYSVASLLEKLFFTDFEALFNNYFRIKEFGYYESYHKIITGYLENIMNDRAFSWAEGLK
ncbi:hypothetical protein HYN59_06045 [Flavobacterium album]|uniref:Uncharacterized protein n=2 Tax=Flavobacterium album TaxID=2175091 RepID=A0A2S1QWA7_9FLAO|nr:hypothetical protein HYN59_06045 [Flavobacterium album]